MELCERYLHYMSALCEGTMPAPPELALTADTTEERAAPSRKRRICASRIWSLPTCFISKRTGAASFLW